MRTLCKLCLLSSLLSVIGCTDSAPPNQTQSSSTNSPTASVASVAAAQNEAPVVTLIQLGDDAEKKAQEALIVAEPGEIIEFAEGTFEFKGTLSLDGITGITIRGKGIDKTILNFTGQRAGSGGEGLKIKADNFTGDTPSLVPRRFPPSW